MANSNDTTLSEAINLSRDETRQQVIDLLQEYLELENVDLTKSSFLSYVIEVMSTMISNVLFYQISTYREFFLTQAQLPESVYNLAAFLGYEAGLASFAQANVLFEIPFGFEDSEVQFEIPLGFKVNSNDGVEFTSPYQNIITVLNNSSATVQARQDTRVFDLPVIVDTDNNLFSFQLVMEQVVEEIQEFQIESDLQTYQFYTLEVPFTGKLADATVEIKDPIEPGYELYERVASLYVMDEDTKGYVLSRNEIGMSLAFGNGIFGVQPPAGGTIRVTLELTEGEDGNVIAGSIRTGERIYNTNDAGITEIVQYDIVNTSAATGGEDEESVEEVRRNAIISLTALERTVTESDYINANVIIDNSPIAEQSLPILKRSDVKVNEIMLFVSFEFNNDIVPTRNVFWTFPAGTTNVPRETVLTVDGIEYYTIYDMTIETLNSVADYIYVLFEFEQVPTLVTSFGSDYSFTADNLVVERDDREVSYQLRYNSLEDDTTLLECEMEILESGQTFSMINLDETANTFLLVLSDYTVIPEGELTYYFTISHPTEGLIGRYQNIFTLRQSLENLTRSNTVDDGTAGVTVYDISTVKKEYYDEVNKREFESEVLQATISTMTFEDYKMMTDFVNLKASNTTGYLQNMQLNDVDRLPVISIESTPPACTTGARYIILNGVGEWEGRDNDIAECSDGTSWSYVTPNTDDMVEVTSEGVKYIYSASGWVVPSYEIPLIVTLDVFKEDTYTGSIAALADLIRETLVSDFEDRFGIEQPIYRSEIVESVQNVDGVEHCRVLTPESNIFFNFDIHEFEQQELLEYGPEYVYFTTDSIEIRIYS